ncbi:MAG: ABC transporter ATP-binding protein [Sphingobacteriales bacterium]|nr:MAG: ABC transporter ATP-binding protein [Sphingobacteriales bacterium]TAF81873.1 MAG: ABC transporter ATP-binding protein [Sphingobacteriales bacterium]
MKELAYLNKFLYKYRYKLLPGALFVILSNLFAVLPAQVIRLAFDLVNDNIALYQLFYGFNRQTIIHQVFGNSLLMFGMLVLLLALIRGMFLFFMRQTIILTSRRIEFDLKNEIYNHYQQLSLSFYRRNNTGDLMARATEDVGRVRMYVGPAIMYTINTAVLFVLTIAAMLSVNITLTIFCLLPLPVLVFSIYKVNRLVNLKSEKIQQRLSTLSAFVQETFSGIRVLKSYGRLAYVRMGFNTHSDSYKHESLDLVKTQALFFPLMLMMVGLSTLITVYVGGLQVISGSITAGNIVEFIVYVNQLTFPITSLGWVTSLIQRGAASQKRINEFLKTSSEIKNPNQHIQLIEGDVSFKNVSFTYPDTGIKALNNVSFEVKKGTVLAIIGKTGSGKSTIANLLMRMYDVNSGQIKINNNEIKQINLEHYRSQTGFVPQEVFLFSDTIARNIAFANLQINMPQIIKAAKDAVVYDNIMGFEKQFDTLIGERGITLSGGQKQRISIARAIINEPKILIFDDCLSAVDTQTEEKILKNLFKLMQHKTSIIIAHRISTIKNADNIIVLDNGSIVEQGNHTHLMALKGVYSSLFKQQLLEEQKK